MNYRILYITLEMMSSVNFKGHEDNEGDTNPKDYLSQHVTPTLDTQR